MKFKVGDKVVGNTTERYCITKKGNGYGVVKEVVDDEISVEWHYKDGRIDDHDYDVASEYFDLMGDEMDKKEFMEQRACDMTVDELKKAIEYKSKFGGIDFKETKGTIKYNKYKSMDMQELIDILKGSNAYSHQFSVHAYISEAGDLVVDFCDFGNALKPAE